MNGNARRFPDPALAVAIVAALLSLAAVFYVHSAGWLLYFGDAESHLHHARRVLDSQTPGIDQLGAYWLPLLHLLTLPFAANDTLWRTGLAGSIPAAFSFVVCTTFLFAVARCVHNSIKAGLVCASLFALNPNALYLQAIPMTESVFLMTLAGSLYFLVRFRQTQSVASIIGAGSMALAGTLTRFDGWFVLPFIAVIVLAYARSRAVLMVSVFLAIALLGPFTWLAFNWWLSGNPLAFYNGPYSPKAIQGPSLYAGQNDWRLAATYFFTTARLVSGAPLFWLGCAGLIVAIYNRLTWPVLLLAAPPLFYVWSLHSGGTPIHLPGMPFPDRWYNTRYGLPMLPLLAFSTTAMAMAVPQRWRTRVLLATVVAAIFPWLWQPSPEKWIAWKESEVNSRARLAWTSEAARYLAIHVHPGDTTFTGSGDVNGVFREAGIPLRRTLSVDNGLFWDAAVARPDLFLRCQWAVAVITPEGRSDGDQVRRALASRHMGDARYTLVKRIQSKDGKIVEIYHRTAFVSPKSAQPHAVRGSTVAALCAAKGSNQQPRHHTPRKRSLTPCDVRPYFAGLPLSRHRATRSGIFASPTHITVSAPPQ